MPVPASPLAERAGFNPSAQGAGHEYWRFQPGRDEMGEIAEMVLDGTICERCGVWLHNGEGNGFPGICKYCQAKNEPTEDTGA
jgi:hypothetical protein